ncbi:hypothetical protein FV242_33755 [Methylobacterium sp. WL64]|uniref:hypothetical protein n=1 Tax=Methylobacterium sp. WL64 TaxID=2603894 RepID=UPI0011CC208B|nr:hypothetical protein [Methylobacterium sp. WL64]TXM96337.1 hypothetical protein FV242_33755 [Methylobacterium sp. WL64]
MKRHAGGEPWIALEGADAVTALARTVLGLKLIPGATIEEAERIAKELQAQVSGLTYARR